MIKKLNIHIKKVLIPISETLFFFTEDSIKEADARKKGTIIFLRSCDLHAVKRMDDIYLRNGQEDYYYKRIRENTKFILMGCEDSFENCFCVSMGTNKNDDYDAYLKLNGDDVYVDVKNDTLKNLFKTNEEIDVKPDFVTNNNIKVSVPENLSLDVMKSEMWKM